MVAVSDDALLRLWGPWPPARASVPSPPARPPWLGSKALECGLVDPSESVVLLVTGREVKASGAPTVPVRVAVVESLDEVEARPGGRGGRRCRWPRRPPARVRRGGPFADRTSITSSTNYADTDERPNTLLPQIRRSSCLSQLVPEAFNEEALYVDLQPTFGHSLFLKCEGFNFAGSVKLKAAREMVEAAERDGVRPRSRS